MLCSPGHQTPLYSRLQETKRLRDVPYRYHDGFHALLHHPQLSAERLESLVLDLYRREYEALEPSVCRVLETHLAGYTSLRGSDVPLHQAPARVHERQVLEIYPILQTAIRLAPTDETRKRLAGLKTEVEAIVDVPPLRRLASAVVPILAAYSRARDRLFPVRQPRVVRREFPGHRRSLGAVALETAHAGGIGS